MIKELKTIFSKEIKQQNKFKLILLYTIIFSFIANAYCWFDYNFSHDSSILIQNDYLWQVSIGRYLHPIYVFIRGELFSPFIIGILSTIWLTISSYFLSEILDIKKNINILLTTGIMCANYVITYMTATYIFELDIYMFSLMFSILACYTCNKYKKYGWIFSIFLFAISLGIYQSFWQVGISILIVLLIKKILSKDKWDVVVKYALKYLFVLVSSLIVYIVGSKIALTYYNISAASSYNSLSNISKLLNIKVLIHSIIDSYSYYFSNIINPHIYNGNYVKWFIISSLIITIISIIIKAINNKTELIEWILLIILLIIFPLASNIIYVISLGNVHELMVYSLLITYILFIVVLEKIVNTKNSKLIFIRKFIIILTVILIIFNSIIFSNQVYMKKHIEYEYTYSTLNRIIYNIEQQENYEFGKTPILFIGTLEKSNLKYQNNYFYYKGAGLKYSFAVTYEETYNNYINKVMAYPMNVVTDIDKIKKYKKNEQVKNMKAYPSKESILTIDDMIVVKLSDK